MPKPAQNCTNPLFSIVTKSFQVWKRKERCKNFREVSACSFCLQGQHLQPHTETRILLAPLSFSIKVICQQKKQSFVFQSRSGCPPTETFNSLSQELMVSDSDPLSLVFVLIFFSRRVIFTVVSKLSFCLHLQQVIAQLGELHIF